MKHKVIQNLIDRAYAAKKQAYSPYSNFQVGCAILYRDNQVISGANIENVSFGATNCAERTALFAGHMEGYRKEDIFLMAIVSDGEDLITPCGICRQVILELCPPEMEIVLTKTRDDYEIVTAAELLPGAFQKFLKNNLST